MGDGAWQYTTYEKRGDEIVAVEHFKADIATGKHGAYRVVVEELRPDGGDCKVTVYDNTDSGIDLRCLMDVAEQAMCSKVYWSDDRLCHWMFDFSSCGHWCEGLFHNNGLPDEIDQWESLHINIEDR